MSTETDEPFTFSRSGLYELVWSKPVQELAKDFNIPTWHSRKRCRRLQIPTEETVRADLFKSCSWPSTLGDTLPRDTGSRIASS